MHNGRTNAYNSDVEKILQLNKMKNMINDKKDNIDSQEEKSKQLEQIKNSINKFNYLFGTQNDVVINSSSSVILSNTGSKKKYNYNYQDKKESVNIKKSLEILRDSSFFETLVKKQSGKDLMTNTVELHYKNMRNIRSTSSLTYLEKVYNNFESLRQKENALLIGFDTETLGDITNKTWSPQGMTEFAMVVNNMTTGTSKEINIALTSLENGINHWDNYEKIKNILSQKNGLEILKQNKDLLISAERYSMYGHKDTIIEFKEMNSNGEFGYSQVLNFGGNEAKRVGDIEQIKKGVEKLTKDSKRIAINQNTGLAQDVSETLKSIGFMVQQNQAKNAMLVNYNGQAFDIPVINKFIKSVYQRQMNTINSNGENSVEYTNAIKAIDYIQDLFGNSPGFNLDEDYVFDAFSTVRTAIDIFGENTVYSGTKTGKSILLQAGNHIYRQENIAEAFYQNQNRSGKAHTALYDTKILNNFFLNNMENSKYNMPLIEWLMTGINEKGILGKTSSLDKKIINSNQYYMSTQSDPLNNNGKRIFNFIKDSNGRIITSSNHIIDTDGTIIYDKILNENPRINKNNFYSVKNIQRVDMSKIDNNLSQLVPEYGLNDLYHVELNTIHSDKYKGTSNNSNINLIFNSQKEMEAWFSSSFSLIGEKSENGEFKLNKSAITDYQIRQLKDGKADIFYHKNKNSDYARFQHLLNIYEDNAIDRRVTNNFLYGDKAIARVSGSLDFYEFIKKNKLDHLSSISLAKLYFDKDYARTIGVSNDLVEKLKNNLTNNLGFKKVVDGEERMVLLDSTARNALFAYDNIRDQHTFYSNLLKYSYKKNSIEFKGNESWTQNLKDLDKSKKDELLNIYDFVMERSNQFIALTLGKTSEKDIRDVVINGKNRLENTSYFKNNYDFRLNNAFYEDKKAVKINGSKRLNSSSNIVTFNLDKENPRSSFLYSLLNEKFDNVSDFTDFELITHKKAVFLDFINNISEEENKKLFKNRKFKTVKKVIEKYGSNFSLESAMQLLQESIKEVKYIDLNEGTLKNETIASSKVSKKIKKMRNNITMEQLEGFGKSAPKYENLNGNKSKINQHVDYLVNNFFMPNKDDFLNGSYKNEIEKNAASILYDNVYEQMKGAVNEIFEAAGISGAYIHYDINKGTLNLIKNNEFIALTDFPKIVEKQGRLFAKSGRQTFVLKHVLDTIDTKEGKKISLRTNLDLNFGREGRLSKRIEDLVKDKSFTLDKFKKEVGYTKYHFNDSPTISHTTLADLLTSNNTVDFRDTDKILTHIFKPDGPYRKIITDLYLQNKLNTPNIIKILEDNLPDDELKSGQLSSVLRMISNADISTILQQFSDSENTQFILQNSNSLGKETRITEGNRFIGNNIFPTIMNKTDNYAKPTLVSALNSKWIKSNTIEHTKKNYEGLLISGPVINSKEIMQNIYLHVQETGMDYQNSFSHRQLYTGVLGVNDIVHKEQERVLSHLIKDGMSESEKEEIIKTYKKASLKVRDSVFEQAKVFDPLLFEGTVGETPQDIKRIGNGLEVVIALNELKDSDKEIKKLIKDSKLIQMMDSIGSISVDEKGVINYKKGIGSIVKSGELIIPYKSYGGTIDNISSPFANGVLGFTIRDEFGNELTEKEINKILNENVSKHSFGKDAHTDLKNFLSIFNENDNYKIGFEIENINKLEAAKMFDNYSEKSMTNLFYAKTGEFDKNVEKYFKLTGGNDLLYHTVLTNKALDSYTKDVQRKFGTKKAQELLEEAGLKSINELKQKITEEQFKYRNIIFGPNGIFRNVSGIANDDVVKHRNEGARISSTIGQAISLVGKYENGGKDNAESFQIGLSKILDFINKGNGKYDFLSETTDSNIKEKRQNYTMNDFALLFDPANQDNEFVFANIEKAKNLLKDLDKTFLSNAKDEDRLHHKNVKVLVGENKFETVEDYYGSLYFYKNEQGEKIAIGSLGVVSKNHAIDSEFQSNVSKEYLDRKKYIQELKAKKDELIEHGELDDRTIKRLKHIQNRIDKEVAIVNSMSDYSRHMKIDDQARNILSNSALNTETEKSLNAFMKGDNRRHYSKLLDETTSGLIKDEGDKIVISDLVRSSNVNKKILDEIKGQITYNPLEEKLLTKEMIRSDNRYTKYADLHERVESLGMKLGTQHAEIFYEGIQAHKAAEFNMTNSVSVDTLINKYNFEYKNLEEYVHTRGRADNEVLESLLHKPLLIDLGEEFNDKRYVAVPGLGKKAGTKEIRQEWHQSLAHLARTYKEYQDLEGLQDDKSAYLKKNILELVDNIRTQSDELVKKDQTLSGLSKVEVNMPYSRVKLMSTMSEELIKSPLAEEMKSSNKLINNIDSESFRNKAMINGKTIAELEKGGVENGGIFFDYRLAGESEFRNAGYFNKKFLTKTMGFKEYKDENGEIVDIEEQMRRHLEIHGTMDIVDRYPNIKDQSLYTGMVFLDRGIGDNETAVAGHSLLKLNGDSDGDMLSTLFLEYKGTNFAAYNKYRSDAERFVRSDNKLSDRNMSAEEFERKIKQQTVTLSKGKVSTDAYDLFRQKQIEMVYRAFENVSNIEDNLLPIFYKESERNYKGMALAITKDGKQSKLEAEVIGGKSILGDVKLFNMEKHVTSGFFVESNKELSEYMQKASDIFENSNIIKNKEDYKYMDKLKSVTNIHEFNTEQSNALDEILSVFSIAKDKKHGLISENEYNKIEKSVLSRIRANTYIEAEISKSGKESIGQINAALYPIRQASEELFGRQMINEETNNSYNPLARQIISDMSEQIEQNIISYKKVQAVAGDERLVKFIDIMNEVRKNKQFNILEGETQSKLVEWNKNYLKGDVIEGMYENLRKKELLTDSMINSQENYYKELLKQGMSEAEALTASKTTVLTQEYVKHVNKLYGSESGEANINLFSNFNRRSGKVSNEKSIEHASLDSYAGVIQSLISESSIGKKAPPIAAYRGLSNNMNDVYEVNAFKDALFDSNSKNITAKIMQDTTKALESANSSSLAIGVLGLASGLLISGFASGNPLKNPNPQEMESSPKTEAMSVPDFFEKQGGYVTGNSQNGYILNIKADTNKGQRHMKRALKQAVKATAGGAVNINMNFKSNNSGGYSDQDIEKLINSYI